MNSVILEYNTENQIYEYSGLLDAYGVNYQPAGYYWQIGEIKDCAAWVLHLSVIRIQIAALIQTVLPELISNSIAFKIIRDYDIAGSILDGSMASDRLGKMVSIYPNDSEALNIAKQLIEITAGFRGPVIPNAVHLGSVVYVQYENSRLQSIIPSFAPAWPFGELAMSTLPKAGKMLNNIYYPIGTLKADAKGDVIKALYFKKLWQIKSCLIKQGRLNMFADEEGRDIQDRLKWQYELYRELGNDIPCPAIFDYFKQNDDTYLAMEFIKGKSFTKWIFSIYQDRIWPDLSSSERLNLLDTVIRIISIIDCLHKKGYVHRDITPENFLIDKKGKISVIDMELAWNIHSNLPSPPFRLGTFGFMSPEQENVLTPTQKEDIYGIGGLLLVTFTNLFPMKFNTKLLDRLEQQVYFFIREKKVSNLVSACMHPDPELRPEINAIQEKLESYATDIKQETIKSSAAGLELTISKKDIGDTIQEAINGLSFPVFLTPKGRWGSKVKKKEDSIGNEQLDMTVYNGWHTGMAGPLWLVAKAKKAGFWVDACQVSYQSSWEYIRDNYFKDPSSAPKGLYAGGPGIALALVEGLDSNLLSADAHTLAYLKQCFSQPSTKLDLAEGWAGEGISLLYCSAWLEKEYRDACLNTCVENILSAQLSDGSWDMQEKNSSKINIPFGLDKGISGVLLFLLLYLQYDKKESVKKACRNGLQWLVKKSVKKSKTRFWLTGTNSRVVDPWGMSKGIPSILLVFIKAYEILKDPLYKEIAEGCLKTIKPRPALMDFTLSAGLAGLGEIYREAYRVFNNPEWEKRANWITGLLINCFHTEERGVGYWIAEPSNVATVDLFFGNSGLLHFMLRSYDSVSIKYFLEPDSIKSN